MGDKNSTGVLALNRHPNCFKFPDSTYYFGLNIAGMWLWVFVFGSTRSNSGMSEYRKLRSNDVIGLQVGRLCDNPNIIHVLLVSLFDYMVLYLMQPDVNECSD